MLIHANPFVLLMLCWVVLHHHVACSEDSIGFKKDYVWKWRVYATAIVDFWNLILILHFTSWCKVCKIEFYIMKIEPYTVEPTTK